MHTLLRIELKSVVVTNLEMVDITTHDARKMYDRHTRRCTRDCNYHTWWWGFCIIQQIKERLESGHQQAARVLHDALHLRDLGWGQIDTHILAEGRAGTIRVAGRRQQRKGQLEKIKLEI